MPTATILDYGVGNLMSVRRAFEKCGADVRISRDPKDVCESARLVIPGVGAFGSCMRALEQNDLSEAVCDFARTGRPTLGICVGMQMLFDASEEFGDHQGLGLIPGRVIALPGTTISGVPHKIPHIGWTEIQPSSDAAAGWDATVLARTSPGTAMYFVHSFTGVPERPEHRLADADYGGRRVSAVVRRDNIFGTQFHPEKSGEAGLNIIRCFLSLGEG